MTGWDWDDLESAGARTPVPLPGQMTIDECIALVEAERLLCRDPSPERKEGPLATASGGPRVRLAKSE